MASTFALMMISLAAIFFIALFVGRLAAQFHIPRVTGYIITGLLFGPSISSLFHVPAIINQTAISRMQAMSDLALALILISIGMQFRGENFKRWRHRILIFSGFEIFITFFLVGISAFIINQTIVRTFLEGTLGLSDSSFRLGIFLGVIAIATAPAATLLVIREYESGGGVTDAVMTLVGLNNLLTIIAFNIAVHFFLTPESSLWTMLLKIILPLGTGAAIGFFMSVWAQRLDAVREYQVLMLGGVAIVGGLCRVMQVDWLLGCFACGAMLANASPKSREILNALKRFDYALYVIFFVIAGANLHLDALMHIGILGIIYVVARSLGKGLGCWLGAKLGRYSDIHQRWTGFTMLAQAGVAIGLSANLRNTWPTGGHVIETIILGSVVIFELIGPIGIRFGLIHAGEIPLLTLLAKKAPVGSFEGLHNVVAYFRASLGLPHHHKVGSAADILVKHIMRQNVETIRENTPFQEVLRQIAHSRYDRFPIVDRNGNFKGVIDYSDIRDVLFDPSLTTLIVAIDLVKPEPLAIRPNQTLGEVLEIFKLHKDISYLPVVDEESGHRLLGIISQNDVLAAFRRLK